MGYLYLSADRIRYEVIRPDKDKRHGFQISRSELIAVQQWVLMGTPENAAEVKTARAVYHFLWMPNDNDLLHPGQPALFKPGDAGAPDALIAALRDPSTVLGGKTPAAAASANEPATPQSGLPTPESDETQPVAHDQAVSPVTTSNSRPRGGKAHDYWKPDTQVGDFEFNMPSGWKQMRTQDGTKLVPSDLAQNSVAAIGFLPAQTLTGDLRSWFNATWAEWQKQFKVVETGEIERRHNPGGFDTLSLDARVTNQSLGYSEFVFAAARVGNRVEPYYWVSNTGSYSYRNAFSDFEHSLTFANLKPSGADEAPGTAGGLDGLYVGYKIRGMIGLETHFEYIAFFPDGNAIRYLPEEGLENFDFGAALRTSRDYCGRYHVDGESFAITWADNNTESGVRKGARLHIGGDEYMPTSHSDGLKLNGTYRREGTDLARSYIRFTPDGRFAENGMLTLVAYSGSNSSPGSGSYHIKNNTLTLDYADGRRIPLSFFIFADEEGSQQPGLIHVNTYALLRGR